MKTFVSSIFAAALIVFPYISQAKKGEKVAFLIRQPNHLKAAFLTLNQMRDGTFPITYVKAVIVVCGPKGLETLKRESSFKNQLSNAKSKNIQVKACGLTLKNLKMKASSLHTAVSVVENGLYEMIRLKTEGFISVDI